TGQPAAALDAVRQRAGELAAAWPGLIVEDKGATLAVHYRAVPDAGEHVNAVLTEAAQASVQALEVLRGKSVCEVRSAGVDKGAALEAFLRAPPFTGRRPLMLGDDVTDEAAFDAALRAGGAAVKVGEGESIAPWRLPAPDAVRAWLAAVLDRRAHE
ncbi:MAG: trehalose-phosphatase, partial [Candidatus Binataceae bacterium]